MKIEKSTYVILEKKDSHLENNAYRIIRGKTYTGESLRRWSNKTFKTKINDSLIKIQVAADKGGWIIFKRVRCW